MKRSQILCLLSMFLLITGTAQAQVADNALTIPAPGQGPGLGGGGSCDVVNIQGALAGGFLSYNAPGGGHATYFDPSATGGPGDPGCGAGDFMTQEFNIANIGITLADASAFGAGTGVGDFDWSITIHDLATPGDPCGGPGAMLWDSGTQTINGDGSGVYTPALPVDINVTGPFFVQWNLIGLSNAAEPLSNLWDGVARPTCRQFVTQDGGSMYTDHSVFFAMGTTGWSDITVNGDFVTPTAPSVPVVEVPTASEYGLIALVALLGLVGALVIRKRMA